MNGWTPKAAEAANSRAPAAPRRTAGGELPSAAPEPVASLVGAEKRKEKEPAEKQVKLPPPPEKPGPWAIGPWELRSTTTYLPACRLVLTGPVADFESLLAYLKDYTP